MTNILDLISRIFLSLVFLVNGYSKINNIEGTIGWMEMYDLPGVFIYPAIILELIGPIFLIIGYQVRITSFIFASFCIATAVIFLRDFSIINASGFLIIIPVSFIIIFASPTFVATGKSLETIPSAKVFEKPSPKDDGKSIISPIL